MILTIIPLTTTDIDTAVEYKNKSIGNVRVASGIAEVKDIATPVLPCDNTTSLRAVDNIANPMAIFPPCVRAVTHKDGISKSVEYLYNCKHNNITNVE